MANLQAITFDVWQTLISDPDGAEDERHVLRGHRMAEVLGRAGYRVAAADLAAACYVAAEAMEAEVWSRDRDLDTPEQIGYVLRALRPAFAEPLDEGVLAALAGAYADVALAIPPGLIFGVPEVLAECRARELRLGVICNTGRTPGQVLRRLFARYGILESFATLTFSNELRLRKPKPAIFTDTLSALGVPAEAAVHVGDDPRTDVAGSKAVGMRAVHVTSGVQAPVLVPPDASIRTVADLLDVDGLFGARP